MVKNYSTITEKEVQDWLDGFICYHSDQALLDLLTGQYGIGTEQRPESTNALDEFREDVLSSRE